MYEDSAVELTAFPPGGRVFCIASAGCTAFDLAAQGHDVTAVDVNMLLQIEVRAAAARRRAAGARQDRPEPRPASACRPGARLAPFRARAFLQLRDTRPTTPSSGAATWTLAASGLPWRRRSAKRLRRLYASPFVGVLRPTSIGSSDTGSSAGSAATRTPKTPMPRRCSWAVRGSEHQPRSHSSPRTRPGSSKAVLRGLRLTLTLSNILDGADEATASGCSRRCGGRRRRERWRSFEASASPWTTTRPCTPPMTARSSERVRVERL